MIKKFNLSKPEKYISKGEEKTYWANVGTMTQFDNGQMIVEIPAIGLKASVFPQERTSLVKPEGLKSKNDETIIEYPEEEVNPEDIPF